MSSRNNRKKLKKIMRQRKLVSIGAMILTLAILALTPVVAIDMAGAEPAIPITGAGLAMAGVVWDVARDHDADRRDREPK